MDSLRKSLWRRIGFKTLLGIGFFTSVIWNWFHLYMWYRRTLTVQEDPCKKYYEVLLVNTLLRVSPIKAIVVTITSMVIDPLKNIRQEINEFIIALLKDLPVTLLIPVLLIVGVIFVVIYGRALNNLQRAILLWRGGRQDLPAPAVEQIRDLPPPAVE